MKAIQVCKANGWSKDFPVESLTIVIDRSVPECVTLDEYASFYDNQAEHLVEALSDHLPQGVLDRVLGKLMLKRASLFKIPMSRPKGGDAGE